jgi:hypothetical protein
MLRLKLENGHFVDTLSDEDFTGLREGDRVHGTLGKDGHSLVSLFINHSDRFRYTFVGWVHPRMGGTCPAARWVGCA